MHQPQYLHVDDESLCLWKFVCIYLCNIWLRCILIELKRRWTQVASILMFKGTLVRIAWNEYVLHVPEHPSRKFIDELIFLFNHLFDWLWLNEFCNFSLTVFLLWLMVSFAELYGKCVKDSICKFTSSNTVICIDFESIFTMKMFLVRCKPS